MPGCLLLPPCSSLPARARLSPFAPVTLRHPAMRRHPQLPPPRAGAALTPRFGKPLASSSLVGCPERGLSQPLLPLLLSLTQSRCCAQRGVLPGRGFGLPRPPGCGELPAGRQGCRCQSSPCVRPLCSHLTRVPWPVGTAGGSRGRLGGDGRPGDAGCVLMLAGAGGDGKSRGSAASATVPTRRGCHVICPRQKGKLGGDAANANEGLL